MACAASSPYPGREARPCFVGGLAQPIWAGYNPEYMEQIPAGFQGCIEGSLDLYKAARVEEEDASQARIYFQGGRQVWREKPAKGLTLYNSPPPVRKAAWINHGHFGTKR